MLAPPNREPCELFADGLPVDESSTEAIFPELGTPNATKLVGELLELPELGAGMVVVDAADTLVDGSGEAPNLKGGPPETLGVSDAPKVILPEVAELTLPVPDGTMSETLTEGVKIAGTAVEISCVLLFNVAVNDPAGVLETSSPLDAAEVTVSDFPFVSSAARGFRHPPFPGSENVTGELVGAKTSSKLEKQ